MDVDVTLSPSLDVGFAVDKRQGRFHLQSAFMLKFELFFDLMIALCHDNFREVKMRTLFYSACSVRISFESFSLGYGGVLSSHLTCSQSPQVMENLRESICYCFFQISIPHYKASAPPHTAK